MLTFIPIPLVASTVSEPALAEVRLKPVPPTSTGRFGSIIKGRIKWQTVQTVSAHAALLAIHRPDSPQGLINPHTSTALAA
jgi:hypothetical protein